MKQPSTVRVLVWDLPLRIFHWLFAASVSAALLFAIAGEHSSLFAWHQIFGLSAAFLLVARIVIGLFGSRYARLSELFSAPMRIGHYISDTIQGKASPSTGHNPLASVVYLAMFTLLALVIITGLNMDSEFAEESHEFFAYSLLALICVHLTGLALHTIRTRENVALSMITGRKLAPSEDGIKSSRPILGLGVLAASVFFIGKLFASYDSVNRTVTLPLTNTVITLGEGEDEGREGGFGEREEDDDDDD